MQQLTNLPQLAELKVFCDVASLRSCSEAAKVNNLPQPTVSRWIHNLEESLGGLLFDRTKRPMQLTPMGQAYYEGCKRLIEQYLELEASLRRSFIGQAISVRVAAIYSVGLWDMGQYVERFEAEHPHARVHIDYVHPDQVYQRVLEGTVDLGLVSFPGRLRELKVLPWREEEMVVVCSPAHPLAQLETVQPDQLDGQKFVTFDKDLVIRREIDRFLREKRVEVEVVHTFDNIEHIKKDVEIGGGLALLPEPTLREELQAGTLRALHLEGCRLVRPVGIIHRRQPPGNAALAFIELLRSAENGQAAAGSRNGATSETNQHPDDNAKRDQNHTRRKRTVP